MVRSLAALEPFNVRPVPGGVDVVEARGGALRGHLIRQRVLDPPAVSRRAGRLRSEVNNSLIIVNFFHKIQNFRQISDLFSQI